MPPVRLPRKMLARRTIPALLTAISVACAVHADETNTPLHEGNSDFKATQAGIKRLNSLVERTSQLESVATNDTVRLECITGKAVKIKGLLDLTQTAAARLPLLISENDERDIEIELGQISIACARAEKLAAEAEVCASGPPAQPKNHPVTAETHAASSLMPLKQSSPRSEKNCIAQRELARLLALAMELQFDAKNSVDAYVVELSKFAIEPLGGWRADKCATLDDLCVAAARALNVKVESPADPVSYLQALRDDGLPVDTLLPPRIEGADPPLLLESEVRAFFTAGYAAPLSSSRPLNPD